MQDNEIGKILFIITVSCYIYYTLWIMATEQIYELIGRRIFPTQYISIAIPAVLLVLLFSSMGITTALLMIFTSLYRTEDYISYYDIYRPIDTKT